MSNVVISRLCNLSCPYCFAGEYMTRRDGHTGTHFIDLAEFERKLDFLKRSGIKDLRLIGGEPTLHPQFSALVDLGHNRGFHVLIFTNGLLSEVQCRHLEGFCEKDCTLLVNMNSQYSTDEQSADLQERRLAVMHRLPRLAAPGFNIFSVDFDLNFLFQAIAETGCRSVIRLGLAHPILNGHNRFLHPKQYPIVGEKIAAYLPLAREMGVKFEFDCGFVRCMFSDEAVNALTQTGSQPHFECSPILDLDLGDGVFYCFSLAGKYRQSLNGVVTAAELREKMSDETDLFRFAGVYPTCSTCGYKNQGICSGGCLAGTIQRFTFAEIDGSQFGMQMSAERKMS